MVRIAFGQSGPARDGSGTIAAVAALAGSGTGGGGGGGDLLSARPNDGSGLWADSSNTGHLNEPNYPGAVTDYTGGMTQGGPVFIQPADGATISYKRMLGKSYVGYNGVGDNLEFVGCVFEGTWPNDTLVQIYCPTTVTFRYCTFKPNQLAAPPGNDGSVSSSPTAPGTPYAQSWQYVSEMVEGTTAVFEHCDVWGNAGIQCTGGAAGTPAIFRDCYIHDQADTDASGAPAGQEYHHDGIGPDSEGGGQDTLIDHCTIASRGSTNGIALQGLSTYNRITIKDCYISGWGYAVGIGATTPWQGTNITVTGNVFSAELEAVFGPFYNVGLWNSGGGSNVWSGNRFQVRDGDQDAALTTADHGKFWWPSDNAAHVTDFAG